VHTKLQKEDIVQVQLYATIRQKAGTGAVEIPVDAGHTVGDVLNALVQVHPQLHKAIWHDDGSLAGHVAVILNGRDVRHIGGLDIPLSNDDRLDIFPPVGGGAGEGELTNVTVKFTAQFRARVGIVQTEFRFNGSTLQQFIPALLQEFEIADLLMSNGELKPYTRVVIDGRFSDLIGGWDAPIQDGSMVVLLYSSYEVLVRDRTL
jgi:molybdopterin synthase sulfur carrier subunit